MAIEKSLLPVWCFHHGRGVLLVSSSVKPGSLAPSLPSCQLGLALAGLTAVVPYRGLAIFGLISVASWGSEAVCHLSLHPRRGGWCSSGCFLPSFPSPSCITDPCRDGKERLHLWEEGVLCKWVSSVLSYFSLNSKYVCLKPFTSLTILQADMGPWKSMCLLKCEVPQAARHQIIAEGEMFDCYFSLLRLLWFGF